MSINEETTLISVECRFRNQANPRAAIGHSEPLVKNEFRAACDFVRARGGAIIEGYPIAPQDEPYPVAYAWTGFERVFKRAGFEEVARSSPTRPIMRKVLLENSDAQ